MIDDTESEPQRKNVFDSFVNASLEDSAKRLSRLERKGRERQPEPSGPVAETPATRDRSWLSEPDRAALRTFLQSPKGVAFSELQAKTMLYLLLQKNQVSQYAMIATAVGCTEEAARGLVRTLHRKGLLQEVSRHRYGQFRGIKFLVDPLTTAPLKEFLTERSRIRNPHERELEGVPSPSFFPRGPDLEHLNRGGLSSEDDGAKSTDLVQEPELRWWQATQGVDNRQIRAWCEELGIDITSMVRYLKHCRFYCLYSEKRETIEKPKNYFYSTLKRQGHFPQPEGYRSFREMELQAIQRDTEAMKLEVSRLEQALIARREVEAKKEALEILSDSTHPLREAVLACLNPLEMSFRDRKPDQFVAIFQKRLEELRAQSPDER